MLLICAVIGFSLASAFVHPSCHSNKENMSNSKKAPATAQANSPVSVNDVLESLAPEQRQVIEGTLFALEQRSFSGPLPAPEDFEAYERVLPGSTDRIIRMAEQSLDSRINNEKIIIETRLKQSGRGQILGFILALFFGIIALVLALKDHEVLAGIIASGDIISLAIIFVLNREPSKKEDNQVHS